jgi:hypothetical protein
MSRIECQAVGVPGEVSLSSRVSISSLMVKGAHATLGTSTMNFEEVRPHLSKKQPRVVRSPDAARADKIMSNKADRIIPFKPST